MHREESVPEHRRRDIPEHEEYESLCALAAGGLLDGAELVDFQAHMKKCSECQSDYGELSTLVARDMPQAQGTFRQRLAAMRAKPLPYSRQRFLRRARAEGVVFSREVETLPQSPPWYFRQVTLGPITALIVVTAGLTVFHFRQTPESGRMKDSTAAHQIAELQQENLALAATRSQLSDSLAKDRREIQNLRAQLATVTSSAENLRRNGQQSSSQNAQLLDESRNQEKLLAEARDEAARGSQMRINDEATLVEQQSRITELTDKLRIASATLEMERQLAAAGKNIPELMAARQLHVIDVRDTDPDGNPGRAFGRVFLTEGKSLTFYAFDLSEDRVLNSKRGFQVWAVPEGGKDPARSLGFLHVDAKGMGRWVLRVDNPDLVKAIGSVFITIEPTPGGKQPDGQKILYAYLGEANHP